MSKICQFINKELPLLKDVLVEMTTKLEVKVDKYLLKNIYYWMQILLLSNSHMIN